MKKSRLNFILKIVISLFVLFLIFIIGLMCGSQKIGLKEVLEAIKNSESVYRTILFRLRLPRTILALISGGLLAGCGAAFQMYFRNSLAEPGIIGISAGATLGAVSAQVLGLGAGIFIFNPLNFFAFAGAIISGLIVTVISSKSKIQNSVTVLLCGTALGTLYASISSILLLTKSREINGIYTWIMGSFNGRGWNEIKFILLPAALSILFLIIIAPQLDLMVGGETSASSLGVNVKRLRLIILLAASFGVSVSVCAGGTINFIGLIAPHLARKIFGPEYSKGKALIPVSMIFGSLLVLLSDIIARTVVAPSEIPAGLITSLLGAPFFISLIFTREAK